MMRPPSTTPVQLERATSRTRTGPHPIDSPSVTALVPAPYGGFSELYAGPVVQPGSVPGLPGTAASPFADQAVQVRAVAADPAADPATLFLILVLDLGQPTDVARIELYGNLLLPPVEDDGQPRHNFGLPRYVGTAVLDGDESYVDRHGLSWSDAWVASDGVHGEYWQPRDVVRDLRGLWGWTPLHLPPTFGQRLMLVFRDLPWVFDEVTGQARRGVDIQRLVVFPFCEDVDHRPQVEFVPVASRQTRFFDPSLFWQSHGEAAPDAARHQGVFREPYLGHALLPSALVGIGHSPHGNAPLSVYASDPLPKDDPEARVVLVLQTTTDEIPLIHGIRLTTVRLPFKGGEGMPDYRIAIDASNDVEAAHSPTLDHPGWKRVMPPRLIRPSLAGERFTEALMFRHPAWARFLRLVVEIVAGPEVQAIDRRFQVESLSLLRPRDYVLIPESDQDIQVDTVVLRLRGPRLMDDYAFVDGASGMGLTLLHREAGGASQDLQRFRTLLELLENAQTRVFANQRLLDRRHQLMTETIDGDHTGTRDSTATTKGEQVTVVRPEFDNRQVVRSGSVTTHSDDPRNALPGTPFHGIPEGPLGEITTRRWYPPFEFPQLPDMTNLATLPAAISSFVESLDDMGQPGTLSIGFNTARSGGASGGIGISISGSDSFGGSISGSVQLGGGTTFTNVSGRQGTVTQGETVTVESRQRQETTATQSTEATETASTQDRRDIERWDRTPEIRRPGVNVRYAGEIEDIILAVIPVGLVLQGRQPPPEADRDRPTTGDPQPVPAGDELRLRIDHLPPGLSLDCEFRGTIFPRGRTG